MKRELRVMLIALCGLALGMPAQSLVVTAVTLHQLRHRRGRGG